MFRAMVTHFRELRVYQVSFKLAQEIYSLSMRWPIEEKYALTDQIRRSSRSVSANIAEAWRKRRYPKHFVSKLTDSDAEAAETQCWLEFANACGYIDEATFQRMNQAYEHVVGGLVNMISKPHTWSGPSNTVREEGVTYLA